MDVGGALLRPTAWHFRRVEDGRKLAYFITKSAWSPDPFDVGLTMNVLRDTPGRFGVSPSQFAAQYVTNASQTLEVERTWSRDLGPFKAQGLVYLGAGASAGFKFYNLIVANDKTGTAYLIIFEAPVAEWAEHWRMIEPTVQKLYLDDIY